jgi:PPOX class probable F420-dependent enzyme
MPRKSLDDRDRELLEAKNFVHVSTLRDDGTIQTVPVWCDVEDSEVVLNTADGRQWPENLRRDGRVTLTVQNFENPYEYVTITGRVAGETTEGADEHIDAMAKKYLGKDEYPFRQPGEQRVIFRIVPERVQRSGS